MEWKHEMKNTLRSAEDLLPYLPLTKAEQEQMTALLKDYPMAVTPYYLSLIDFDDPNDPIRKMAIPSLAETVLDGSFDTSGEAGNTVVEGLQHKYTQTAMMLSTNQCAMYCRHCFRKRLVGLSDEEIAKHFDTMRSYIMQHKEITNVLVSGGDALLNSNRRLDTILSMLVDIPHLDLIRIATRTPVVLPSRITADDGLVELLAEYNAQKQLVLVTQFNHPNELTPQAIEAVQQILQLGIPVKNQAVLLRGVNDSGEVLGALLRKLTQNGIAPYYIFQCRPVTGVKPQFQVPLLQGIHIINEAKAMQNGVGKTARYCMSHVSGKLEILGLAGDDELLFQYHEARDAENLGKLFTKKLTGGQAWLDEDTLV